jgi:hypothetical protein
VALFVRQLKETKKRFNILGKGPASKNDTRK